MSDYSTAGSEEPPSPVPDPDIIPAVSSDGGNGQEDGESHAISLLENEDETIIQLPSQLEDCIDNKDGEYAREDEDCDISGDVTASQILSTNASTSVAMRRPSEIFLSTSVYDDDVLAIDSSVDHHHSVDDGDGLTIPFAGNQTDHRQFQQKAKKIIEVNQQPDTESQPEPDNDELHESNSRGVRLEAKDSTVYGPEDDEDEEDEDDGNFQDVDSTEVSETEPFQGMMSSKQPMVDPDEELSEDQDEGGGASSGKAGLFPFRKKTSEMSRTDEILSSIKARSSSDNYYSSSDSELDSQGKGDSEWKSGTSPRSGKQRQQPQQQSSSSRASRFSVSGGRIKPPSGSSSPASSSPVTSLTMGIIYPDGLKNDTDNISAISTPMSDISSIRVEGETMYSPRSYDVQAHNTLVVPEVHLQEMTLEATSSEIIPQKKMAIETIEVKTVNGNQSTELNDMKKIATPANQKVYKAAVPEPVVASAVSTGIDRTREEVSIIVGPSEKLEPVMEVDQEEESDESRTSELSESDCESALVVDDEDDLFACAQNITEKFTSNKSTPLPSQKNSTMTSSGIQISTTTPFSSPDKSAHQQQKQQYNQASAQSTPTTTTTTTTTLSPAATTSSTASPVTPGLLSKQRSFRSFSNGSNTSTSQSTSSVNSSPMVVSTPPPRELSLSKQSSFRRLQDGTVPTASLCEMFSEMEKKAIMENAAQANSNVPVSASQVEVDQENQQTSIDDAAIDNALQEYEAPSAKYSTPISHGGVSMTLSPMRSSGNLKKSLSPASSFTGRPASMRPTSPANAVRGSLVVNTNIATISNHHTPASSSGTSPRATTPTGLAPIPLTEFKHIGVRNFPNDVDNDSLGSTTSRKSSRSNASGAHSSSKPTTSAPASMMSPPTSTTVSTVVSPSSGSHLKALPVPMKAPSKLPVPTKPPPKVKAPAPVLKSRQTKDKDKSKTEVNSYSSSANSDLRKGSMSPDVISSSAVGDLTRSPPPTTAAVGGDMTMNVHSEERIKRPPRSSTPPKKRPPTKPIVGSPSYMKDTNASSAHKARSPSTSPTRNTRSSAPFKAGAHGIPPQPPVSPSRLGRSTIASPPGANLKSSSFASTTPSVSSSSSSYVAKPRASSATGSTAASRAAVYTGSTASPLRGPAPPRPPAQKRSASVPPPSSSSSSVMSSASLRSSTTNNRPLATIRETSGSKTLSTPNSSAKKSTTTSSTSASKFSSPPSSLMTKPATKNSKTPTRSPSPPSRSRELHSAERRGSKTEDSINTLTTVKEERGEHSKRPTNDEHHAEVLSPPPTNANKRSSSPQPLNIPNPWSLSASSVASSIDVGDFLKRKKAAIAPTTTTKRTTGHF